MASVTAPLRSSNTKVLTDSHAVLSRELRRLTRAATFVALMTSPFAFFWFHHHEGWSLRKSLIVTFVAIVVFRGMVDVLVRRVVPWPSLFGTDDARLREEDTTNRRRAWTWRWFFRWVVRIGGVVTIAYLLELQFAAPGSSITWLGTLKAPWVHINNFTSNPQNDIIFIQIPILFGA